MNEWTDLMKLMITFHNYVNAPKIKVILRKKTVYSKHFRMCKSTLQNSSSGQGSPLYITSGDISSTNSNETAVIESRDTGVDDCSDPVSDPGNKFITHFMLFTSLASMIILINRDQHNMYISGHSKKKSL
jgi:hypothetical protein